MRCAHTVVRHRLKPLGRGMVLPALPADWAKKTTGDALMRTPRGLFVFCLLRFGPCRGFFWRKR